MAITVDSVTMTPGAPSEPVRVLELQVDLDASYPTGGYDVTASINTEGTQTIVMAPLCPISDGTTLRYLQINPSTKKVQVFAQTTLAEVAAATDLSANTNKKVYCFVK